MPSTARPGLPDQVVARLLAGIGDCTYPPGSRLPPEAVLAERAGVSRLTLREAVKVLRDKGVVRVEQGRGTFVNPPGQWSPLDPVLLASRASLEGDVGGTAQRVTEARRVVEVGAAELASQRRTDSHLAHLHGTIDRMHEAHQRGDVVAFSAADMEFHDGVMLAAENPFLAALLQPIKALLHEVRVQTSMEGDMRVRAVAAHGAILAAVAAGDATAAREAMTGHMAETHRVIQRVVTSTDATQHAARGDEERNVS